MIRGSASIDTGHFKNKQKQLQNKIKFPSIFNTKIDTKKVKIQVIKPWIKASVENILSFEDDVVINLIYNLLEKDRFPDAKDITVSLLGFLEEDTLVLYCLLFVFYFFLFFNYKKFITNKVITIFIIKAFYE